MARVERKGSANDMEISMKARGTSQSMKDDDDVRKIKLQKFYFYHFNLFSWALCIEIVAVGGSSLFVG